MAFFLKQDCPFCKDYGQIGFMLCDDLQKIVFMCDECDGIWISPETISAEETYVAELPEWKINGIGCGLGSGSRWANREEIERVGWGDLIAYEGEAL